MKLTSYGAARSSRPMPTRSAPGAQRITLAHIITGSKGGGPPRWAGRPPTAAASVFQGINGNGADPLENLLVDDEGEPEDVQHSERHDDKPYQPRPAFCPLLGDPAPHRRQPENDQRDADGDGLIEALVEDGVAIPVRCAEGLEPVKQQQVKEDESPDDVGHPLQPLPVLPEFALRRGVGRRQDREGQGDDEQPGQQEGVPGEPTQNTPGKLRGDSRGGRVSDTYDREPD